MSFLKLHSYEPETEPPAPLPFDASDQSWRRAQRGSTTEEESMDSIARAEQALDSLQGKINNLVEQVDEYFDPIPMSHWMPAEDDDDGPWAA